MRPYTNLPDPEEPPAAARLEEGKAPVAVVGLRQIFGAFLQLGCTAFGGNIAGWLYRELVLRRRWIDDATFLSDFALGQAIPGSNGVKLTVQIGQRLHGAAGAAVALIGLLTGPFAIVLAIGAAYARFGEHRIVHAMLDGVAAAVIGLTFATGLRSAAHGAPGPAALTIAGATVLGVGVMRWPMFPVILGLAPVSIALAFARPRLR